MHTKTKQHTARLSLAGAARRLIGAAVVAATLAACGGVGAGGTSTAWLTDHRGFGGPATWAPTEPSRVARTAEIRL
jgi:hypothetical protein